MNTSMYILRRLFLLPVLFVVIATSTQAKDISYTSAVNKVDLVAQSSDPNNYTTIRLSDPTYRYADPREGVDYIHRYTAVPALVYNRNYKSDLAGNVWSYQVEYEITYTDPNLNQSVLRSGILVIEHNNIEGVYEALSIHEEVGGNLRLRIINIIEIGNVPNDIHLELQLKVEYYNYLDESEEITSTQIVPGNDQTRTEIAWQPVEGAEYYEVEWVFWDVESRKYSTLGTLDYKEFFERAVRIETKLTHHTVDLFYPDGVVFFRVRAVGRYIRNVDGDFSHLKFGSWYEPGSFTDFTKGIIFGSTIGGNKIWQAQRSFAEEAKSKQVIQYFDQAMKGRQTLTNLSSDDVTIVAENVYDVEGRASLSILPVPVKSLIGKNPLQFGSSTVNLAEGGLVSTGAIDYTYKDFDKTTHADPLTKVDADGKQHVSSMYYSSENPFNNSIHRDYIPDAEGYAITQVKLLNDATGRVARQSGVGAFYQLGTNRETKYYYGNPTHAEVRRLFGRNVGDEKHYRKNYVVDANGQISTSYIDQTGQTIATALAGASPENVHPLTSETGATSTITSSIIGKNILNETGSVLSHSIFCDQAPRTDQFTYTLKGGTITLPHPTTTICIGCQYQIEISLVDEYKNEIPLLLNSSGGGPTIANGINILTVGNRITIDYNSNYDNTCSPIPTVVVEFEATLQNIGSYELVKTLKVIEPDPNSLITSLQNSGVLPNRQDFIDQYITANIDSTECDDCSDALRSQLSHELAKAEYPGYADEPIGSANHTTYLNRAQYYINNTSTYPDCDDLRGILALETGLESECAAKLERMKQQIAPAGEPSTGSQGCLNDEIDFWQQVYTRNHNPFELDAQNAAGVLLFYNSSSFESYIMADENWEDQFVDDYDVITSHPEYCAYEAYCLDEDVLASRRFDFELAKTKTWIEAIDFATNLQVPATITTPISMASVDQLIALDPFNNVDNSFAFNMENALDDYCTDNYNNGVTTIPAGVSCSSSDVLSFVDDVLGDPDLYTNNAPDLTPLSNEQKWLFFRGIYMQEKTKIQQAYLDNINTCSSGSPYVPSSGVSNTCHRIIVADEMDKWFEDNGVANSSDLSNVTAFDANVATNNCTAICEGNARNWISQLCPNMLPADPAYSTLLTHFVDFCTGHCGPTTDNPMGYILAEYLDVNSTTTYALTPGTASFNQDLKSAQDLLVSLVGTNNSAGDPFCNHDLLNNPPLTDDLSTLTLNRSDVYEFRTDIFVPGTSAERCDYLNCFFTELNNANIFPTKFTSFSGSCANNISVEVDQGIIKEYNFSYTVNPVGATPYCDYNAFYIGLNEGFGSHNYIGGGQSLPSGGVSIELTNSQTGTVINPLEIYSLANYNCLTGNIDVNLVTPCNSFPSNLPNGNTTLNCSQITPNCPSDMLVAVQARVNVVQTDDYAPLFQNQGIWVLKKNQLTINYDSVKIQCLEQQMAELSRQAEDAYDAFLEEKINQLTIGDPCMSFTETMKTTYTTTEHHYTLYYYDQAGNLIQTLPPAAVVPLDGTNFNTGSGLWNGTAPSHNYHLATTYQYNTLGQVVEQESPDGGITEFWYDYAQRLRFSRNAKQLQQQQFAYTKFDDQGRTTEVGCLENRTTVTDWEMNRTTFPENTFTLSEKIITEYEEAGLSPIAQQNLRGRVARTYNNNIATYYDYDAHGNVKKIHHQISGFGASEIEYDYDLITSNVKQVAFMKGTEDQFFHRYDYDADNRLTKVQTSTNGCSWDQDAQYFYYAHGPLARVELGQDQVQGLDYFYNLQGWIKGVNNTSKTTDLGRDGLIDDGTTGPVPYSVNKWFGQDQAAYYLGYHREDYKPIGNGTNLGIFEHSSTTSFNTDIKGSSTVEGLYNGNIAFMISHIPSLKIANSATNATQAMVYEYDALHRITKAESYGYTGNWNKNGLNNAYRTAYTYDANGNIQTLDRHTLNSNNTTAPEHIDQIAYNYDVNPRYKNRLASIVDSRGITAGINDVDGSTYIYDAIGNLTSDGTSSMSWNLQNKVAGVDNNDYEISYTYDISGNRLRKILDSKTGGVPTRITYYIRDASGNIMATYLVEEDAGNYLKRLEEAPVYGSSRLGVHRYGTELATFIVPSTIDPAEMNASLGGSLGVNRTGKVTRGEKVFELSNHLGNVLVTISDMKLGYVTSLGQTAAQGYKAQVQSASDYYPFGWNMPGRTYSAGEEYRFGFNGKENDKDWGDQLIQDYGFRLYNPSIGKFLSVDPLAPDYPWYTPYQFAGNKPIVAIDLDGLEEDLVIFQDLDHEKQKAAQKKLDERLIAGTVKMNSHGDIVQNGYINSSGKCWNCDRTYSEATTDVTFVLLNLTCLNLIDDYFFGVGVDGKDLVNEALMSTLPVGKLDNVITTPKTFVAPKQKALRSSSGRAIINSSQRGGINKRASVLGFDIPIKANGYPDFSKFIKRGANGKPIEVVIEMTGSYKKDFKAAFNQANKKGAGLTQTEGGGYTPEGYTWHHTEYTRTFNNGTTKIYNKMQLVRADAHKAARHSGGVSVYKEKTGNKKSY